MKTKLLRKLRKKFWVKYNPATKFYLTNTYWCPKTKKKQKAISEYGFTLLCYARQYYYKDTRGYKKTIKIT